MDDLLKFLHARYEADNHAYADVAYRSGANALLDSHLPMLDLVDMLARDYAAMDPSDARFAGLGHALRVLAQSYAEHPDYRRIGDHRTWPRWVPERHKISARAGEPAQSPVRQHRVESPSRGRRPPAAFDAGSVLLTRRRVTD